MLNEFLSTAEAAELLGYSEYHVRELAKKKQIPALRVRRRWRFPRERILEWIHQGCPSQEEQPSLFR